MVNTKPIDESYRFLNFTLKALDQVKLRRAVKLYRLDQARRSGGKCLIVTLQMLQHDSEEMKAAVKDFFDFERRRSEASQEDSAWLQSRSSFNEQSTKQINVTMAEIFARLNINLLQKREQQEKRELDAPSLASDDSSDLEGDIGVYSYRNSPPYINDESPASYQTRFGRPSNPRPPHDTIQVTPGQKRGREARDSDFAAEAGPSKARKGIDRGQVLAARNDSGLGFPAIATGSSSKKQSPPVAESSGLRSYDRNSTATIGEAESTFKDSLRHELYADIMGALDETDNGNSSMIAGRPSNEVPETGNRPVSAAYQRASMLSTNLSSMSENTLSGSDNDRLEISNPKLRNGVDLPAIPPTDDPCTSQDQTLPPSMRSMHSENGGTTSHRDPPRSSNAFRTTDSRGIDTALETRTTPRSMGNTTATSNASTLGPETISPNKAPTMATPRVKIQYWILQTCDLSGRKAYEQWTIDGFRTQSITSVFEAATELSHIKVTNTLKLKLQTADRDWVWRIHRDQGVQFEGIKGDIGNKLNAASRANGNGGEDFLLYIEPQTNEKADPLPSLDPSDEVVSW